MGIADLGERNSRDEEVSPDMESKESENEGSDEKSGVHRMNTFWALWTREGGMKPSVQEHSGRGDRKLRADLPPNPPTSILGGAAIRFLTITDLFGNRVCYVT